MLRHPCNCCRWLILLNRWAGASFNFFSVLSGLYYLAELVEEYTVMTAKVNRIFNLIGNWLFSIHDDVLQVIRWMVIITLLVYICLFLFENLPTSLIACGIIAQVSIVWTWFLGFLIKSTHFMFGHDALRIGCLHISWLMINRWRIFAGCPSCPSFLVPLLLRLFGIIYPVGDNGKDRPSFKY